MITRDMNEKLTRKYTGEEVLKALNQIHPLKAPGPDEGLSTLIRNKEEEGLLHGIKIARTAPSISHLFFADDSLLFVRATNQEAAQINEIMQCYEKATGQVVNIDKSEVTFSHNVPEIRQNELVKSLNFKAVPSHDKYLGLPTYIGRSKKEVFEVLMHRVWKKMKGWKEKLLSRAGREVLIKAVVQAIPIFFMQCFDVPTCAEDFGGPKILIKEASTG